MGRVWGLVGTLIVLAAVAAAATIWLLHGYRSQDLRGAAAAASSLAAEQAQAILDAARFQVRAARRELLLRHEAAYWPRHPEELQEILTAIDQDDLERGLFDIGAVDASGRMLALSYRPEVRGLDLSDTPYFRELLAGADQALSDPAPSRVTGMRPVHYVEWVKDEAGKPVFALGTAINPRLLDKLHAGMVDQATAASALFKPDGTLVAGVWPPDGIDAFGDDGAWIVARAPVPGWPLVAVAGTPTRVIWRQIMLPSATVLGAVLLLSAGIALVTQIWHERQRAYAALLRTEARQRLLLDELNHRVKNILATVQSVAVQTLRGSASLEEFERAFEGRLEALSRTSTLLAVNSWRAAELGAIIETALAPYRGADGNVRLDGPGVTLPPKAALTLSLVLHELATTAAKYGALAAPGGRVAVTWRTEESRGRLLSLDWTERDGPRVDEPTRCGFGRRLIERSVAYELGGASRLEFPPEGARCRIELPLEG